MDLQVAGQWRREWAGTAEFGDVVEGGVTRRVARAMEVLNASAPGARVRVMRAAYHSTAAPGRPASTYLMHSSRQVISSGNRFLEQSSSSSPIKPLEISSTPLESSHDSEAERENYKVTEPDDLDISEPSKWKGSTSKSSIRLPSEESSSADNASIIDLDSRTNSRNSFRRSFRRKEDPILEGHRMNPRVSPLLDAPVALNTLKYTSLLNGTDDWNDRRKSYSFEDPAPSQTSFNKRVRQEKDKFTFDSSTDSGICKSSEIVDDQRNFSHLDKSPFEPENNTFRDWLSKNRSYKMKPIKTKHFDDNSSNISLKSTGKVTITLPVTLESDTASESVSNSNEDSDRKIKRVEFCKTELHFAAESGTVNIIATDEKPPPTNDFRRKRSAFVPLKDRFEKPITLFGDKSDLFDSVTDEMKLNIQNDENTAATKSILKNKIPKPKPYLLGENMEFGNVDSNSSKDSDTFSVPTSVSLINRQLQSARHIHSPSYLSDIDTTVIPHEVSKTNTKGLENHNETIHTIVRDHVLDHPVRRVKKSSSPEPGKSKSRELRKSDLAYFGIYNDKEKKTPSHDNLQEEIFHSVKLVQKVSNSVSNSEIDSDEAPEYENLSTRYSQMIPTPKPRTKYKSEVKSLKESETLRTIPERVNESVNDMRRAALNKYSSISNDDRDKSRSRNSKSTITRGSPGPRHNKNEYSSDYNKKEIYNNATDVKERSVTPLYMNIKTSRDKVASEKQTKNHTDHKSTKDRSSKRLSKSPEHKNRIVEKVETTKNDNVLAKLDKIDQNNYTKSTKENIDRLATPKHRPKREDMENLLPKKKTLANKNPNDVNDNNDTNSRSTSSRKKLIENSNLSLIKSTRNNDKENKRDTLREKIKSNTKILSDPMQLEMSAKSKYGGEGTKDLKIISVEKPKKMKRSEYVINYDDKNGTVSSIRKIVNGTNSHRKIKTPVDSKDSPVQYTRKTTATGKIASLQRPDHQTFKDKLEYKYRMRKSKMNVPKTCQLL
ncbi:transcription initiation factor TFIID subunit 1-like [Aricia agestis]|uniref:transcription initiation factor TFIID subunit 1-like n=1 Tax=Aricia agestis TaxID=91739 RepID=UPI001C204E6E|nr:transcription initiation factor TFIID subunit 1-like [Aricia agestis]